MAAQNIFAQFAQPVRSVADYQADYDAQDLRRQQLVGAQRNNALAALTAQQQTEGMARNALVQAAQRKAAETAGGDESVYAKNLRLSGFPELIDPADKVDKAATERGKAKSENAGRDVETENKVVSQWRDMIGNAVNQQQAAQMVAAMHSDPRIANTPMAKVPLDQAMRMLQGTPFDQWKQQFALGAQKFVEMNKPTYQQQDLGGTRQTLALPGLGGTPTVASSAPITQSADNAATQETARRGQNLVNARAVDANSIAKEAQQTQVINDPERGIILVNKGTKVALPAVGPDGKAIPSENAAKSTKQWGQMGQSIAMARELIPNATASGAGAMVDKAANFVGKSTDGADAASKLRTLAGWMTSNTPRMEGPQSDKDTAQYRIMAAKVGDETIPVSQRLAALDVLEEIGSRYGGMKPAVKAAKPASATGPFTDAAKEQRYQEWKRQQGR